MLMFAAMGYNFWLVVNIAFSMALWNFVFAVLDDRKLIKET